MLDLAIFKNGSRILPPTARVTGLRFGSGRHGFAALDAFLPMDLVQAAGFYSEVRLADVQVTDDDGSCVWRGRVEDASIENGGVRIGAFGYARAMSDLLYTALWSVTGTTNWRGVTVEEVSTAANDRYEMDTNNRLYIAIKKDELSSTSLRGQLVYELPDRGARGALIISGTADMAVSDGNAWLCDVQAYTENWVALGLAGTIAISSGTTTWSYGAPVGTQKLVVRFCREFAPATKYGGETGETYVRLTNLRIKSTASSTVVASGIAAALVADVAAVNSSQISGSAARIETTTADLKDEIYEDMRHADVLDRLATRENYWWGVWNDMRLFFAPVGEGGRKLMVDVAELTLEGSLEPVANRTYATYTEVGGRTRRTAVADDVDSQMATGVVRMAMVQAETTSEAEAARWRDALLTDQANYALRAEVIFNHVYTIGGVLFPLAAVRAGDVITMRNLPATLETGLVVRSFRVAVSEFDAIANRLRVEPDSPTPTLVTLIAKRGG